MGACLQRDAIAWGVFSACIKVGINEVGKDETSMYLCTNCWLGGWTSLIIEGHHKQLFSIASQGKRPGPHTLTQKNRTPAVGLFSHPLLPEVVSPECFTPPPLMPMIYYCLPFSDPTTQISSTRQKDIKHKSKASVLRHDAGHTHTKEQAKNSTRYLQEEGRQ